MYNALVNNLINDETLDKQSLKSTFETLEALSEEKKSILVALLSKFLVENKQLSPFISVLFELANIDPISTQAIDICGTGGSGLNRINTSTISAFILSSLGLPILKHGNKAATGRFGSFDLIEALGIPIHQSAEIHLKSLEETKLSLIYAPDVFPFLKHFSNARKQLEVASVFNVLGPLLNPYKPTRQFIGTPFQSLSPLIVATAKSLGREQITVYGGFDKLDDVTLTTETFVETSTEKHRLSPLNFGLSEEALTPIHSNEERVQIAKNILNGTEDSSHFRLVIMNCAFIYGQFQNVTDYASIYQMVTHHVKSGHARTQFNRYKEAIHDYTR